MQKIDYKKELKHLYKPGNKPEIIKVPKMNYVTLEGKGDPNTSELFQQSVEALYATCYNCKFYLKELGSEIDATVMPLEGQWYMKGNKFDVNDRQNWLWKIMIMQPGHIKRAHIAEARKRAFKKKGNARINDIIFEPIIEGTSVQVMHIGSFSEEGPVIANMHNYAKEQGYKLRDRHHEIYLNDFRKVDPAKMKTVLRQPLEKA